MPDDKSVERRRQTLQKLELMDRYWGAWCTILAQTTGRHHFCPARLWLIDTHAGSGTHQSDTDPDGTVAGTPTRAALVARATQRRFPDVQVAVRATDIRKSIAEELRIALAPYKGTPPAGVDIDVRSIDWVKAVPRIAEEIAQEGHTHAGKAGSRVHEHRSLWFIDPFGPESIDHAVIQTLPVGAEVIINLDLMGVVRLAGKARAGEDEVAALLDRVYGSRIWDEIARRRDPQLPLADALAESFTRWQFRKAYALRATGSQDRAMIHLAESPGAVGPFEQAVKTSMKAGTIAAGRTMTTMEKDKAAKALFEKFRGLTLTTDLMAIAFAGYKLDQLRWICTIAETSGYGEWDGARRTMAWYSERRRPGGPSLGL